ncbi:MAG: polyprenyl synthetase family protein, partial [Caulobacter sp.]|nr:polyprenyl synthetase family protein [Caulobacter sp.]
MDAAAATLPRTSGSVDRLVRLAETDMAGVNRLITERMQSDVPIIPALAEHLIAAGGKRLRPLLTVAAARLAASDGAGSDNDHCLKLAAAVEFIHTATLLHD